MKNTVLDKLLVNVLCQTPLSSLTIFLLTCNKILMWRFAKNPKQTTYNFYSFHIKKKIHCKIVVHLQSLHIIIQLLFLSFPFVPYVAELQHCVLNRTAWRLAKVFLTMSNYFSPTQNHPKTSLFYSAHAKHIY